MQRRIRLLAETALGVVFLKPPSDVGEFAALEEVVLAP